MEQREFIVEAEAAGQRIDRFLSGEDTGLSRSALQGLVAEGHVLCNGRSIAKSLKLKAGDTILLEIPDAKPIEAVPQDIPLDIVYEDDHLLVVNKPKGMVVHPAPGNPEPFVVRPAETDVLSKRQIRHPVTVTLVDNAFGVVLRVVVDDDDLVDDVFGFVEDRIDRLHE